VPPFGDDASTPAEVDRFYDFWAGFKSWRDFSSEGEHDVEMAKNRWERRAMQKENEKAAPPLPPVLTGRVSSLLPY